MSTYTVVGVVSHYVKPPALLPVTVLDGTPDVVGGEPSDPSGYTRYVSVADAADDVEAIRIVRPGRTDARRPRCCRPPMADRPRRNRNIGPAPRKKRPDEASSVRPHRRPLPATAGRAVPTQIAAPLV